MARLAVHLTVSLRGSATQGWTQALPNLPLFQSRARLAAGRRRPFSLRRGPQAVPEDSARRAQDYSSGRDDRTAATTSRIPLASCGGVRLSRTREACVASTTTRCCAVAGQRRWLLRLRSQPTSSCPRPAVMTASGLLAKSTRVAAWWVAVAPSRKLVDVALDAAGGRHAGTGFVARSWGQAVVGVTDQVRRTQVCSGRHQHRDAPYEVIRPICGGCRAHHGCGGVQQHHAGDLVGVLGGEGERRRGRRRSDQPAHRARGCEPGSAACAGR